jgi:hypothetical protein
MATFSPESRCVASLTLPKPPDLKDQLDAYGIKIEN